MKKQLVTLLTTYFLSGSIGLNLALANNKHQFHHPASQLTAIAKTKNPAKSVYQQYCKTCHGLKPAIPIGAPRIGVSREWQARLKQPFALLFKHAEQGYRAMPAMGGCFECSDKLLKETIEYMLPKKVS